MPETQGAASHFPMDPFPMVGFDDLELFSNSRTVKFFIFKSPVTCSGRMVRKQMRGGSITHNYARKTPSHPISPQSSSMEEFFGVWVWVFIKTITFSNTEVAQDSN